MGGANGPRDSGGTVMRKPTNVERPDFMDSRRADSTFQSSLLLRVGSEALARAAELAVEEQVADGAVGGAHECGTCVLRWRRALLVAPGEEGTLVFGTFAEDEAEEHVEAADGEEHERGDEREVVDMV